MFLCACRNKLIEKPFAPLTQQYETCSNDPTTAFLTQAGVSAGNVSILSPLGVIFVLFLLSMYQMASGAKIAKNYTPNEKQAALDALAVALLLVRDKKLEEHEYRSRTSSSSTSGKANDKSNGKGKGGAGGNDGSERSSSLAEEARAYSQYGYGSKKKKDTKNGHLHDGLETSSAGAPVNERKSRVLAEIVEQLAEIAVVAAEDEELYRKRTEDPVYIDWSALGRQVSYMLYGSEEERRRKKQKKQELREESSVTDNDSGDNSGVENRTRGDSAQDDVELTTVSQLHSTVV